MAGGRVGATADLGEGVGVLAGSAFSIRVGVASFFTPGVFFGLAFGAGVSSDSGLFFTPGFFVGSGDSVRFGFGVDSSSSLLAFFGFVLAFGVDDSSGSGVGLFFAFGLGVGCVLVFALRLAGFGFAFGSGVSAGVGEGTARISSRAFARASRFFFSSSLSCA